MEWIVFAVIIILIVALSGCPAPVPREPTEEELKNLEIRHFSINWDYSATELQERCELCSTYGGNNCRAGHLFSHSLYKDDKPSNPIWCNLTSDDKTVRMYLGWELSRGYLGQISITENHTFKLCCGTICENQTLFSPC